MAHDLDVANAYEAESRSHGDLYAWCTVSDLVFLLSP